jgi:hypothetical protein
MVLTIFVGLTAACTTTTAYWDRPGATLPQLVSEANGCYRDALGEESPSALPAAGTGPRLLPRSEPPPALWKRAPRQAGLERFDEQLRYERCMRARGWLPVGLATLRR